MKEYKTMMLCEDCIAEMRSRGEKVYFCEMLYTYDESEEDGVICDYCEEYADLYECIIVDEYEQEEDMKRRLQERLEREGFLTQMDRLKRVVYTLAQLDTEPTQYEQEKAKLRKEIGDIEKAIEERAEVFYTGGGVTIATLKDPNYENGERYYTIDSTCADCLNYYKDGGENGEEFPFVALVWSMSMEEPTHQKTVYDVIYDSMRKALGKEVMM